MCLNTATIRICCCALKLELDFKVSRDRMLLNIDETCMLSLKYGVQTDSLQSTVVSLSKYSS